jgi:chorismate lyase / 3-hydroxybenzoate synthase
MRVALDGPRRGFDSIGLEWLGGDLTEEHWNIAAPVESGQDGDLRFRQAGDLLYIACELPDDGIGDPADQTERLYSTILALAKARGCPVLLRAWNFMPGINRGEGDRERYRRFCLGRARALEAAGIRERELCAGTAIGGEDPYLRIQVLTGRQAGINIENPRQVSAYRYPRIYGPRSPSFARATAIGQPDGSALLMISGTASVVGHRTVHEGDVNAQTDEIIVNLGTVLEESVQRLGRPGLAGFGSHSLLRVYVRHAEHWPEIRERLRAAWPDAPIIGLRGDVCRSDLLVEIEAVSSG